MSQGIIIRTKGPERSKEMEVFQGIFDCEICQESFAIYFHAAHPENVEDQICWLDAQLRKDHIGEADHQDSYSYPW
jgi:hypothetical protein